MFRPQKGKQEKFLACSADICIYGGAAGGGKSYALLLEPLRHIGNKQFAAVTFRRTNPQILSPGGLWSESFNIYSLLGATPKLSPKPMWVFPSGATITFSHLEMESTKYDWQGSQIPLIMFDELTHFSESVFFYMLSRNRSMCGVKPYIRATCNPDADSWVANFISWWIDQDSGYPIEERCGKIRWFIRRDEKVYWADRKQDLWEQFNLTTDEEKAEPRSVSFINSTLQDNKLLMQRDPSYLATLKALPTVERERLLYGNWKIKQAAGLYFKRPQVRNMLPCAPADVTSDVINQRLSASDVRALIKLTAEVDNAKYGNVRVRLPQDPGQAGKDQAQSFVRLLSGFSVRTEPVSGSKESRAEPVAAQWQAGNFDLVIADWNESYFSQIESFPASKFKDMVDATSDAFSELERRTGFHFSF